MASNGCLKDAPLLFNPSPSLQKYKWILGFLMATFDGKHKSKTQETIELAKRARQIYFDIADHEGIDFDLLKEGILHFMIIKRIKCCCK